jgi:hypothetical protein
MRMRKAGALLFALFLAASCIIVAKPAFPEVTEDSWVSKAPMQQARAGLGVAAVNGKIYAIGGTSGTKTLLGTNEVYDPKTNTWSTKAPLPTPRYDFGIRLSKQDLLRRRSNNGRK